jgi:predicted metal-dependent hydrolase
MKVENRNIKYPRIELRTGELHFVLPLNMSHHPILDKYDGWIKEKKDEINDAFNRAGNLKLSYRKPDEVKGLIQNLVNKFSEEQGVSVERIIIRDLKSKWGSCSSKGNLTLNKMLRYLPDKHFKYVVFHEIIHLIERKHTHKYWSMISEKFPERNYYHIGF